MPSECKNWIPVRIFLHQVLITPSRGYFIFLRYLSCNSRKCLLSYRARRDQLRDDDKVSISHEVINADQNVGTSLLFDSFQYFGKVFHVFFLRVLTWEDLVDIVDTPGYFATRLIVVPSKYLAVLAFRYQLRVLKYMSSN